MGYLRFVACHVPSRPSIRSECRPLRLNMPCSFLMHRLCRSGLLPSGRLGRGSLRRVIWNPPSTHHAAQRLCPEASPRPRAASAGGSARRGARSSYHRMTRVLEGTVPRDPEAPTFLRYRFSFSRQQPTRPSRAPRTPASGFRPRPRGHGPLRALALAPSPSRTKPRQEASGSSRLRRSVQKLPARRERVRSALYLPDNASRSAGISIGPLLCGSTWQGMFSVSWTLPRSAVSSGWNPNNWSSSILSRHEML